MNNIITLQQLKDKDACTPQLLLFKETFGKSVTLTEELCIKHAQDFDWSWAAYNLLSAPARKVYNETSESAWKVYDKTRAPAQKVYNETLASAFYKAYTNQ